MDSFDVIRVDLKHDFDICDGLYSAKTRVVQVADRPFPFSRQMWRMQRLHRRLDGFTDSYVAGPTFPTAARIILKQSEN
jgi:hypothetical protein